MLSDLLHASTVIVQTPVINAYLALTVGVVMAVAAWRFLPGLLAGMIMPKSGCAMAQFYRGILTIVLSPACGVLAWYSFTLLRVS